MSLRDTINHDRLPVHIAVIMDGNGRWAKQRDADRIYGHRQGVESVRQVIEGAAEIGVKYLTLYAFSTENWNRPWEEVEALMEIMVDSLNNECDTLIKNNIVLRVIGDIERLSPKVRKSLDATLDRTSVCTGMIVTVALSYSSRWEILNAARMLAEQVRKGVLDPSEIDKDQFESHLTTAGVPDPELVVRTSGELRISNFLLWQIAYAEFYFTETLWPDFGKEDLYRAIIEYQKERDVLEKLVNRFMMGKDNTTKNLLRLLVIILLAAPGALLNGQERAPIIDYSYPDEYVIGDITVSGVRFLDPNAIVGISGLRKFSRIAVPGESITQAVEKLWSQGLFSDIRITITERRADTLFLDIFLGERPRISSVNYFGTKKAEKDDIAEKVNLLAGSQVTDHVISKTKRIIEEYFVEKGFLNTVVRIVQKDDPDSQNSIMLNIHVDKNDKVKISDILFHGNEQFSDKRLRREMKNTKKRNLNFFKASKYIEDKYAEDKKSLVNFYNENGYRDFEILSDTVYPVEEDRVVMELELEEGIQYYFRDITWTGNSIYPKEFLSQVLNIERGDVFNTTLLEERIRIDEDAVSSLYLDNGYLFSDMTPVITAIDGDSVDIEVRIFEGEQANLNNVIIRGNTRTNEHVVRRELYTLPGDLFSKDKIMRSARQIAVLGHFDPEKINPIPLQNPMEGTVDLEYNLEEKANDQFEISGGWGAGMLVGTIGVRFNNFAMKNFFKGSEWRPYPSGDGQSLSIRAQSNGRVYQSYNLSFMEPWLGGTKPNTFSVSLYRSLMTNGRKVGEDGRQSMIIDGASIGLGKRLEWPDDYFSLFTELSYQRYSLTNYNVYSFLFKNGNSNLLSLTTRLTRFSAGPNLIYPMGGSTFNISLQATPPYSVISGKDFSDVTDQEKYKFIEFHKWEFKGEYYYRVFEQSKFVFNTKVAFGYLGHYNKDIGPSPFENFYLGGDGMTGYSFYGRDVIALRGYENGSLTPLINNVPSGNVYSKLTFELRYPFSLNPQATIYGLMFLEAGNSWYELKDYNPFRMHRSAGLGIRANLPMFGLLGIDWGYGFDAVPGRPDANGHQFHFVMGQQF